MADRQNIQQSYTVVASPSDATETVIASVGNLSSLYSNQSFKLHGWAFVIAEASAVSCILKLRRASLTGTLVGTSPTYNGTDILAPLGAIVEMYAQDTQVDVAGATYVLTATLASAAGASTVSAVYLEARVD